MEKNGKETIKAADFHLFSRQSALPDERVFSAKAICPIATGHLTEKAIDASTIQRERSVVIKEKQTQK